jgi:hypothetical protein
MKKPKDKFPEIITKELWKISRYKPGENMLEDSLIDDVKQNIIIAYVKGRHVAHVAGYHAGERKALGSVSKV